MAHACGCQHGSSRSSAGGAGLTLAEASASVGMPRTTSPAARNEGGQAPA